MAVFNFNNKTFSLIDNSEKGSASENTVFKYKQEGNMVTADYQGGGIKYGKIIARLEEDTLYMLYQCITDDDQLKAGKAVAKLSFGAEHKIKMQLDWQWLTESEQKGVSEYIEN